MARIMVIAAHPDDEILGSGGAIKRFINEGDDAYSLILTSGVTGRCDKVDESVQLQIEQLRKESMAASGIIGFKGTDFCNLPDNRLDGLPLLDIIKIIESKLDDIKPTVIFTHHYGDLNIDHRITFQAVVTAARPVGTYTAEEIYSFETLSSTEWDFTYNTSFKPNVFIDIGKTFNDKADALKCYKSEMREYPHPRSLEALEMTARKWGTVVGCGMAEAFELIRKVKK